MGHLTAKNYRSIYKRMDQFVNGVFDSKEFYEILKILFTDEWETGYFGIAFSN